MSYEPGVVVRAMLGDYLLSPLEVVGRTGTRRQEELGSHAIPVTMIWLVRRFAYIHVHVYSSCPSCIVYMSGDNA